MEAALITGLETVELIDFPEPVPAPGGVVVDIDLCGICGTDVHAYHADRPYPPAICGHEWTGLVSATGADVSGLAEGDRVVVAVTPACGACEPCRAGQARWCGTAFAMTIGLDPEAPPHGGFAPRVAVPAGRVVAADPGLTVAQAAQVEPATVAFHAVRHSPPRLGDIAVVQGAGPIGLTTLQWVIAAGAGQVVVVEPNPARGRLAAELGASTVVTPEEAPEVIAEATRGLGADVVYECVGRPAAIQQAVDATRRGGTMCLIGVAEGQATIDPVAWLVKELEVRSALAYTHDDFERTMGMMVDGRCVVEPLHTATVGLSGLGPALADLGSGTSAEIKVLVDPRA